MARGPIDLGPDGLAAPRRGGASLAIGITAAVVAIGGGIGALAASTAVAASPAHVASAGAHDDQRAQILAATDLFGTPSPEPPAQTDESSLMSGSAGDSGSGPVAAPTPSHHEDGQDTEKDLEQNSAPMPQVQPSGEGD